MTKEQHTPAADNDPASEYEIRIAGHLAPRWSTWFDGLSIVTESDGTTVIRGSVVDQAALHGLLQKLRDVGIPLLSLTQISSNPPGERPASPNQKET